MKHHSLPIAALLIALTAPASAFAQSAKDMEDAAYILCNEMIGKPAEADACADWIATSVTTGTYRRRAPEIDKFLSEENMLAYRIKADGMLNPSKSEPLTAYQLNLDILTSLNDQKDRNERAQRLVEWGNRLTPQQMPMALDAFLDLDDFLLLMDIKEVKAFVIRARDAVTDAPDGLSKTGADILSYFYEELPELMTPKAKAELLCHLIGEKQFGTARELLYELDLAALPKDLLKKTVNKVFSAEKDIFGDIDFKSVACYPEFSQVPGAHDSLLIQLNSVNQTPYIAARLAASRIRACDFAGATARVFGVFSENTTHPDAPKLLDRFMTYALDHKSDKLTETVIHHASKLTGTAKTVFMTKYDTKLYTLGLDGSRRALESKDADRAISILEALLMLKEKKAQHKISQEHKAKIREAQFELGRAYQMKGNATQARKLWDEVFTSNKDMQAERALYLLYLSYKKEKNENEATQTKALYETTFPGKDTSQW